MVRSNSALGKLNSEESMAWFAVRTLFRTRLVGRARHRDAYYRPGLAAIEDRVVLFRTKDGASALRRARAEARKYAKAGKRLNAYGQRVITEPLGYAEAYELESKPGDGAETFSAIELTDAREPASTIIARKVGEPSGPPMARLFIAGDITRRLDQAGASWAPRQPADNPFQRPARARRR